MNRRWIVSTVDAGQRERLVRELSILPATASVLLARGLSTPEMANQWMIPTAVIPYDPFLLPDMEQAIDRLHRGVKTREPICFYGDYDVDGIAATSIYSVFFKDLAATTRYYIPHRIDEGYGLNVAAVRRLHAQGVRLIVTSDCGSLAFDEVRLARDLGMDVIVTDHHHLESNLPEALAVINPKRLDSRYPFSHLCSGGLAYKVIKAYEKKFGPSQRSSDDLLDLVALSTVADVMPLQDENRVLVREGLRLLGSGARCGIRALKRVAGVEEECTAATIAYKLAPRINAVGRLGHAEAGVRLFTTENDEEAAMLATQCERFNKERQGIEGDITREARAMLPHEALPPALVLAKPGWHLGVIGIVAARLVERFGRPTVMLTIHENGLAKGSARGVAGVDLCSALESCRNLLETYGGHPAAAGLSLRADCLSAFRARFEEVVRTCLPSQREQPDLYADAEIPLQEMNRRLIKELDQLQPFGVGNPEPTLVVRKASILEARVVGDSHLRLTVRHQNSVPFQGIGFRMGEMMNLGLKTSQLVDLAVVPELNRWKGMDRIQLRIRDLQVDQGL